MQPVPGHTGPRPRPRPRCRWCDVPLRPGATFEVTVQNRDGVRVTLMRLHNCPRCLRGELLRPEDTQ